MLSAPAEDYNMTSFLPSCHAFPVMAGMPMACWANAWAFQPKHNFLAILCLAECPCPLACSIDILHVLVLLSLHVHVQEQTTSFVLAVLTAKSNECRRANLRCSFE